MIDVDISHIWNGISLPELLETEREIFAAHERLAEELADVPAPELERIAAAAEAIRSAVPICVVIAAADQLTGIQAAMELLPHPEKGTQLLFAGFTLSTRQWNRLTAQLEGKDFTLLVISQTGTILESAIAFRDLRWLMERRFGTEAMEKRIFAVTREDSPLWQMARQQRWECFATRSGLYENVLGPGGLLPLAVAGMDIARILQGAERAKADYDLRSFENPLWLYAGVRNALCRKGCRLEVLGGFYPGFRQLGIWWQQLFSGMEGRCGKGPFPIPAEYPQDLYGPGWRLLSGEQGVFETLLCVSGEDAAHTVGSDVNDLEGLNCLAGKTLEEVRQQMYQSTVSDHDDAGIPVMTMDLGQLDPEKLGEIFAFFTLACGISAHILGADTAPCHEEDIGAN